jgi:hypothetical protein
VPLATKKLIAYIDQNLISNIVKAKEGISTVPTSLLFSRCLPTACGRKSWFARDHGSIAKRAA